jgi:modulator of FtsH protease HflC
MKRNRLIIATTVALIAIFSSLLFVFQVRKSEVAMVTTFGKPTRNVTEPGAYFKWPWPIQSVYKLDKRIQNFETSYEEARLPDQYTLLMQVYVGWAIEKPELFFPRFVNGSVLEAEKQLGEVVGNAKNEVVGNHTFGDFISADEKQMKFVQIESEILEKVKAQLKQRDYGIDVKFVQIKKIGLPESVTDKVFDRMTSERDKFIAKIKSEGDEQAANIKSRADSEAASLISDAEAKASQIRGEGELAAIKSLAVMQQNPELANFNMKLAALKKMLKDNKTTLILDQNTSPMDLLNNSQPHPDKESEAKK